MRKVMILASMLAMVMLAASPALAQQTQNASAGDNSNISQAQCQNVIGDINVQGGDNIAVGGDQDAGNSQYQYGDNVNFQQIAQENNTNVTVVQNCFAAAAAGDINVEAPVEDDAPADDQYEAPADDQYVAPEDDAAAAAGAGAAAPAGDDAAAAGAGAAAPAEGGAVAVLPDTGGASLFTLGAGALLVAGGLLARRIIR